MCIVRQRAEATEIARRHAGGESGFAISSELVIILTLVVIGLIVGLVAIRDATTAEMGDLSEAFGALDQSYDPDGIRDDGTRSYVAGSSWSDTMDNGIFGGQGDQGPAGDVQGIDFDVAPNGDETFP